MSIKRENDNLGLLFINSSGLLTITPDSNNAKFNEDALNKAITISIASDLWKNTVGKSKDMRIIHVKFRGKSYYFEQRSKDIWELVTPFFCIVDYSLHLDFYIQRGFLTDFRSGPKFINWFIPKFSMVFVLHDYLYQTGILLSRKRSDKIQDMLLKEDKNFNYIQRKLIYLVVRITGKKYWNYYRTGGKFPYINK
jgi:hypothetical protein